MCGAYVTLFLDFCFIFAIVVLESTGANFIYVSGPMEVSKLSKRSGTLQMLHSNSKISLIDLDLKKERSQIALQNMQAVPVSVSIPLSGGVPEQVAYRSLSLIQSQILTPSKRSESTPPNNQELIYRGGINDVMSHTSRRKRDVNTSKSLPKNNNLLTKRDYYNLLSTARSEVSRNTRSAVKSDFRQTSIGHNQRQMVKRDSSLLTVYCGPLGDRCQYVPPLQCVQICINNRRKVICKVRNRNKAWVCVVA